MQTRSPLPLVLVGVCGLHLVDCGVSMRCLAGYLALLIFGFLPFGCAEAQSKDDLEGLGRRLDQLQQSAQYTEALPVVEQLSEVLRTTFGENSGEYAAILARRAGVLQALGRYKDAE